MIHVDFLNLKKKFFFVLGIRLLSKKPNADVGPMRVLLFLLMFLLMAHVVLLANIICCILGLDGEHIER